MSPSDPADREARAARIARSRGPDGDAAHADPDVGGRLLTYSGRALRAPNLTRVGLLEIPILYLSRYETSHKADYYRLLQTVSLKRRELFDALNRTYFAWPGSPIFVVTLHAMVKLGDATMADFDAALREVWAAPYQIDLRPFHADKAPEQNIWNLVHYALKHECRSTFW